MYKLPLISIEGLTICQGNDLNIYIAILFYSEGLIIVKGRRMYHFHFSVQSD